MIDLLKIKAPGCKILVETCYCKLLATEHFMMSCAQFIVASQTIQHALRRMNDSEDTSHVLTPAI